MTTGAAILQWLVLTPIVFTIKALHCLRIFNILSILHLLGATFVHTVQQNNI